MTRVILWLGIAVSTTYLVFIGGGWAGIYLPQLRIISVVLAAAGLVIWAAAAVRNPIWRAQSAMWPAVVAAIASLSVSTLFSRYPRVSLEYLGYAIVLAALYLLLVRLLANPFYRRRLVTLAALLFVAVSGAYLVAVALHWLEWWGLVGRLTIPPLRPRFEGLTYLNPSAVLTMVALLAVPAAAYLPPTKRGRAGFAGIVGVVLLIGLLSGSRAGWLAIALTIATGALLAIRQASVRAALGAGRRRLMSSARLRLAAGAVIVAAVAGAVVVAPAILRRLGDGGESERLQYAVVGVRLFLESPVVGTGPGSWVIQRIATTTAQERDFYIPHAHNLEVQTLAELGLIGAVAAGIVIWSIVRLLRSAGRGADPDRRRWAWLATISLSYFVFHQLLDVYANMPAVLFAATFPLAYLDATREPTRDAAPRTWSTFATWQLSPSLVTLGVVAVAVIASVGLLAQEGPALTAARGVQLADSGDWAAADAPASEAVARDPRIGSYGFTAGLTAAHAGDHARAAARFEAVANADDLPEAWLNLAAEQVILGETDAAGASLERALRVGGQRVGIAMPAGDLALRIDRPDLADTAFARALKLWPLLAADPWWRASSSKREQSLPLASDRVSHDNDPEVLWQLRLAEGERAEATRYAASLPDADFLGHVIRGWGATGDPVATSESFDACLAQPQNLDRQLWCARLASSRGDRESETRFAALAEFLIPGVTAHAGLLRVATSDGEGAAAGDLATFWGNFTYRRFTPRDMLVPSLLHLVVE